MKISFNTLLAGVLIPIATVLIAVGIIESDKENFLYGIIFFLSAVILICFHIMREQRRDIKRILGFEGESIFAMMQNDKVVKIMEVADPKLN